MRVAVLGDLHQPWALWPLLAKFSKWLDWYQPDAVVQVGDFIDGYSWSRYDKAPDSPSAAQEWEQVERSAERLHSMFPTDLNWFIVEGNHDRRIQQKAFGAGLPSQLVRPLSEAFPFENWNWHVRQNPLVVDRVAYIHGDEVLGKGVSIAKDVGRPTVHGHRHIEAAIEYGDTFTQQWWAMNVGCAMDAASIAGRYANKRVVRSWLGWGTVTDGIPALYPWSKMKGWSQKKSSKSR